MCTHLYNESVMFIPWRFYLFYPDCLVQYRQPEQPETGTIDTKPRGTFREV